MITGFYNMFSIDFARQIGVPGCVQILSGLGQNANISGGKIVPKPSRNCPGASVKL